jgi:hypothetical protein
MSDPVQQPAVLPRRQWILAFARPDIQTQSGRLQRLNGLRGMDYAYSACHYLWKTPSAISLEYSAPKGSLGKPDGQKRSNNIMQTYIKGIRAPRRGSRGKNGFDLVGAISKHPKGALAERSLDRTIYEMLNPRTSLQRLRELLFGLPGEVRDTIFDMDHAREEKHVAWYRRPMENCALPSDLGPLLLRLSRVPCHPEVPEAKLVFSVFEALVGLWAEARLMYDRARMAEIYKVIDLAQDFVLADETFPYIFSPFLSFLAFDGPDYAPSSRPPKPGASA